jgi:hypothetical protein
MRRHSWRVAGIALFLMLCSVPAMAQDAFPSHSPSRDELPTVVQVTGTQSGGDFVAWGQRDGYFLTDIVASDARLSGRYELWVKYGYSGEGTAGAIVVCKPLRCPWGSEGSPSWGGEWVATTEPSWLPEDGSSAFPETRVFLRGRAENEGLSAMLRLGADGGMIEGTLYTTPDAWW